MLKAWQPLTDCKTAFDRLELVTDDEEWRIYWVACVTLLRTVGHVLKNEDSKVSNIHKCVIGEHFKGLRAEKSHPHIFWDFIKKERDNVIKQYIFAPELSQQVVAVVIETEHGQIVDDLADAPIIDFLDMDWPESQDCNAVRDGRDLVCEAIEWWESQLHSIQGIIRSRRGK